MLNMEGFVRRRKTFTLGGKEFTFSELTLADFAQCRQRIVDQRDATKDKRRQRLVEDAEKIGGIDPMQLLEKLDKPITEEELDAEMDTFDGIGFTLYLSLKYAHPEIRLEDAMAIISIGKIEEISKFIGKSSEEDKKKPKKRTRQKRKVKK